MRIPPYLERVGEPGARDATADTLRRLHAAHRRTFLFENLTIQTGGRISLALPDLERKFLDERRGGYCFEHNTLFAGVLRAIGFTPATLLGRVRSGPPEQWRRTHMVLRVPATRQMPDTLCDVGFGGLGLLEPMPLVDGASEVQGGIAYTLRRERHVWVLSMRDAGGAAADLYEFADDPQTPADVEVANHFTATHPDSVFRRSVTVQRSSVDERVILRNVSLVRYRRGVKSEETIEPSLRPAVVHELFGIEWPEGPLVCEAAALPLNTPGRNRRGISAVHRSRTGGSSRRTPARCRREN